MLKGINNKVADSYCSPRFAHFAMCSMWTNALLSACQIMHPFIKHQVTQPLSSQSFIVCVININYRMRWPNLYLNCSFQCKIKQVSLRMLQLTKCHVTLGLLVYFLGNIFFLGEHTQIFQPS